MLMKNIILLIISSFTILNLFGQPKSPLDYNPQSSNYKVIALMNYCITAMSTMAENKTLYVLQIESDRLINNLKYSESVGIKEIQEFRSDLIEKLGKFEINAEERALIKQVTSMRRDNLKWEALSSALSSPMILTQKGSLPQSVFYSLLATTRSVVEYKNISKELEIEELNAMWMLRKDDMLQMIGLRKDACDKIQSLFNKYHLSENDRITEDDISRFSDDLRETDSKKRLNKLLDKADRLYALPAYYYHIGMAYLDLKEFENANKYFDKYLDLYKKAPIFRYDAMSGCIALAKLNYEKNLSLQSAESLINIALNNLPDNSAATLQCALTYISKYKKIDSGLELLRKGIDNSQATDVNLLVMAASKLMSQSKLSTTYNELKHAIETTKNIDLGSYLSYTINTGGSWDEINEKLRFADESYRNMTLIGTHLNDNVQILIGPNISYNPNQFSMFIETHNEDYIKIRQLDPIPEGSFSKEEIEKVSCFKDNISRGLHYLFVETIIPEKLFVLKKDLPIDLIKNQKYSKMGQYLIGPDGLKEILKFCNDHKVETSEKIKIISKPNKTNYHQYSENTKYIPYIGTYFKIKDYLNPPIAHNNGSVLCEYYGEKIFEYMPFHSNKMHGDYLKIVFSDGLTLMYKYNEDTKRLDPYYSMIINNGKPKFSYTKLAMLEDYFLINKSNKAYDKAEIEKLKF